MKYYELVGNVIHSKPKSTSIIMKNGKPGKRITIGFPVCTVSEYVDPLQVMRALEQAAGGDNGDQ